MTEVFVSGSFDDLRSRHMRLLQKAAGQGGVGVLLWDDELVRKATGADPKFPFAERRYFLESIRYVDAVAPLAFTGRGREATVARSAFGAPKTWACDERDADAADELQAGEAGIAYHAFTESQLAGFPEPSPAGGERTRPQVVVTGCYDWLHTGHVRFFEEVAELGDLHVVVGSDANVRLLKGQGLPLHDEHERRYMVGSIRFVNQAYVSSGAGWLDAEPEIGLIRPDIYVVNEDGDRPEKREFCAARGIDYRVLVRKPKAGLAQRSSTALRGF